MKHIHKATGIEFEVGFLYDVDGKMFDMTVITLGGCNRTELVNYYFGGYDKEMTDKYIDAWIEESDTIAQAEKIVDAYYVTNNEVLDADGCVTVALTRSNLQDILDRRDIYQTSDGLTPEEQRIKDKAKRLHKLCEQFPHD